jgi:hypothetical protein
MPETNALDSQELAIITAIRYIKNHKIKCAVTLNFNESGDFIFCEPKAGLTPRELIERMQAGKPLI